MKFDRKSYVLGILTIVGLISFIGIAFADSEIGDRIVALWYHGNISNTTGYPYSNLTSIPINITYNDTRNNFTVNQTFNQGINTKMVNLTGTVQVNTQNTSNSELKPANVFTVINFTVETVDSHNAWNGSAFITPVDGNYTISSGIQVYNNTAGTFFDQKIFVNGALRNTLWASSKITTINGAVGSGTGVLSLKAGDVVDFRAYSDVYYVVIGDSTSYLTFVNIIKTG